MANNISKKREILIDFHNQLKALNKLSDRTRINRQVFVREAVDDLLKKYQRRKGGKK